jgi:hypothetical protein
MKKKKKRYIAGICLLLLFGIALGGYLYIADDYPASEDAIALLQSSENITFQKEQDAYFLYPEGDMADEISSETGIIFYPGAKVQEIAYLPLLEGLAQEGYLCVCMHMPLQLAVLDIDAGDKVIGTYPEVKHWYVMGHSLGGAMAANYAAKREEQIDGLILLGAYAANNLQDSKIKVLSIYGSEDHILNRKKYAQSLTNLPSNFEEYIIEGGNHAQFGVYGVQKGDGTGLISGEMQREETIHLILQFLQ